MSTFEFSKGTEALVPIIVPDEADRIIRFAARELKKYLKTVTHADFQIVNESEVSPETPAIILGVSDIEKQEDLKLDPCRAPYDGFTIKHLRNRLFIRGHNSRSTLYGVYDLLEVVGCIFAEPGIEHVPRKEDLKLSIDSRQEVADFALRNVFRNINARSKNQPFHFMDPELVLPQIDWMAKKRLNHYEFYVDYYRFDLWEKHKAPVLDALLDRGFDLELSHHSVHYFCPPDANHDFGDYGEATYLQHHPDWYIASGECSARGRWQTRVELPEIQQIITERFLEFFKRNDELKIASLWPDDVPMNTPDGNLNPAEGYLDTFWNKIARNLASELPDKFLAILAYFELLKAPEVIRPEENLHCWFCPIDRDYRVPINAEQNRHFIPDLEKWCHCMGEGHVSIFEYIGWSIPLIPFHSWMKEDLSVYQAVGVGGVKGWSGFNLNALGEDYRWALDLTVLAELLWDQSKDTDVIKQNWAKTVYRESAEEILEFYLFLVCSFESRHKEVLAEGMESFRDEYRWLEIDKFHKAQEILGNARSKTADESVVRRVNLLEKTLTGAITV